MINTNVLDWNAEAMKIHGICQSDSGSDSGLSEFDDKYYQCLPCPISVPESQVVVIRRNISKGDTSLDQVPSSSLVSSKIKINDARKIATKTKTKANTSQVPSSSILSYKINENVKNTENLSNKISGLKTKTNTSLYQTPTPLVSDNIDGHVKNTRMVAKKINRLETKTNISYHQIPTDSSVYSETNENREIGNENQRSNSMMDEVFSSCIGCCSIL